MKIINLIFLISIFFTFSSLSDETTSWELLKEGGKVVFIRHAYAPGGGDPNNFELYDLDKDLSESTNLAEINIEKKNELLIDLNNWRKAKNAPIPSRFNPYYDQKYVDSLMFLIDKNLISGKVNKNE